MLIRQLQLRISSNTHYTQTLRTLTQNDFQKDIKNTEKGKTPSNKTPSLSESMNMDIFMVGLSNQLLN